ncbi:MAG: phosphodiester glycosidase family protein [Calditrichaeota bacterium]|nr:phosphodiester glycosidase family protein [Calditrichota bacterium]
MKPNVLPISLIIFITILLFGNKLAKAQDSIWERIDEGLFIGEFISQQKSIVGDSKIVIIKINPDKYLFKLLSSRELNVPNMTAAEWCKKYRLIGAINAGMFQADGKTNVGYMKNYNFINNPKINPKYKSVAAFNPLDNKRPLFRIYDLDIHDAREIIDTYNIVVQNLRLIKRPGKNRWSPQKKKWSEAALGEDKEGNVLFIFSSSPYSMHDFNNILLKLPIGIVAAQHLEGGPEASLYFSYKGKTIQLFGSYETNFNENDSNNSYWPIPNIIGISKK